VIRLSVFTSRRSTRADAGSAAPSAQHDAETVELLIAALPLDRPVDGDGGDSDTTRLREERKYSSMTSASIGPYSALTMSRMSSSVRGVDEVQRFESRETPELGDLQLHREVRSFTSARARSRRTRSEQVHRPADLFVARHDDRIETGSASSAPGAKRDLFSPRSRDAVAESVSFAASSASS